MATTTRSQVSSERQKWDKIFEGLVKMLRSQQEQLESLVKERKNLEDFIKNQRERWVSDIRLSEELISRLKGQIVAQEMACLLEGAKTKVLVGLKNRETSLCTLKLEQAEDELADFIAWFDFLTKPLKDISLKDSMKVYKEKAGDGDSNIKAGDSKTVEGEVRRLMLECQKLASEKNSEVSALLRENGFAWEQFRHLESTFTNKLKSKDAEVEQANEKISSLLFRVEQLQVSNHEKDETITTLKTKVAEMEADSKKWSGEISRLSQEIESVRKSGSVSVTPALKHCTARARTSNLGGKNGSRAGSNIVVIKDLSGARVSYPVRGSEKVSRGSKRRGVDDPPISETPKLFTSNFKVPKLKISSP